MTMAKQKGRRDGERGDPALRPDGWSTIRLDHVTAGVQNGIHPGCGGDGTRVLRRVAHNRARERCDISAGVASELKALGHKPGAFPFRSTSLFLVSVARLKEKPRR
jgi:hypothetical protein